MDLLMYYTMDFFSILFIYYYSTWNEASTGLYHCSSVIVLCDELQKDWRKKMSGNGYEIPQADPLDQPG